ncbi:biotin/lipoyl-containing protein [Aestuariivirga sp.]|uniref:biotin/lipoyl-containing protein n=1 Tax=Aestuariivirga sp. TaxID=2650926 RepID=UPI0039E46F39
MARIKVLLPQWGMGMSEGTIVKWLKAVGDTVAEDEPLAEVESEKTVEVIESPAAGTLSEILMEAGTVVPVRTPVAIIEKA